MKIYAYVTTETCKLRHAVVRGAVIGRDETPVSKHGDYTTWHYGKRETLEIIAGNHVHQHPGLGGGGRAAYLTASARAVARLKGWM